MRLYKKGTKGTYYVDVRNADGSRERKSLGTSDKAIAQAIVGKMEHEKLLHDHLGIIPPYPFEDALFRYAEYRKKLNPKGYETSVKYHLEVLWGRFDGAMCHEIKLARIQDFADERIEEVAEGTVQKELGLLKAILNKAFREERLTKQPIFPRMKALQGRYRFLTGPEEDRLLEVAPEHLKAIIVMSIDTGGRRSEVLSLDWSKVSLEQGTIAFVQTKNGKDRTVGITQRVREVLEKIGPKQSGPVLTFKGKAMLDVKKSFSVALEKAGIEDFRFHDMRHTYASRLVQGGVSLYSVQMLMGHSTPSMVQRYAHLAPDHFREAVNALEPKGHQKGTVKSVNDNQISANLLMGNGAVAGN